MIRIYSGQGVEGRVDGDEHERWKVEKRIGGAERRNVHDIKPRKSLQRPLHFTRRPSSSFRCTSYTKHRTSSMLRYSSCKKGRAYWLVRDPDLRSIGKYNSGALIS